MEPEDGVIRVCGIAEVEVLAVTAFGIENRSGLIGMERDRQA